MVSRRIPRPGQRSSGRRAGIVGGTQIPTPGYPGQDQPGRRPQDAPAPGQQPDRGQPDFRPGPGSDPMAGFPFPHRTFRTRGGSQVTVSGCCLPLPIGCLTTVVAGAAVGLVRLRSRH